MTLTEEQRAALKRVVAYMDEMYAIASPYHGCTEDANILRAMIDSSGTVEPVGGFDLERARGLRDFLQDDCAEVGDVWAEMIAEIERLRAALDESEQILAHKTKTATHWYDEHLQARADRVQTRRVVEQQAARIKELETWLKKERSARLRKASGSTLFDFLKENEIDFDVFFDGKALGQLQDEGKIGPDADAKPREGLYGKYCISKADGSPVDPNADYFVLRLDTDPVARRAAREYSYVTPDRDLARGLQDRLAKYDPQLKDCMNIQFFGLAKPHCWQITAERKAALWHAIKVLKENDIMEEPEEHLWDEEVTVLQAMMKEAGQE